MTGQQTVRGLPLVVVPGGGPPVVFQVRPLWSSRYGRLGGAPQLWAFSTATLGQLRDAAEAYHRQNQENQG